MPVRLSSAILQLFCAGLLAADDARAASVERGLEHILRWEILWHESPDGFRAPGNRRVQVAIYQGPGRVAYCSRDVGVCAEYLAPGVQGWELCRTRKIGGAQDDLAELRSWVKTKEAASDLKAGSVRFVAGEGNYSGQPKPGESSMAESFWAAKMTIGTRDEIIAQYRRLHPAQIESLADWLRRDLRGDDEIRSATIPCFDLADPVIYVSVDRIRKGPCVLVVRHDEDREGWSLLGVYEGFKERNSVTELRRVAGSIACSTLHFR